MSLSVLMRQPKKLFYHLAHTNCVVLQGRYTGTKLITFLDTTWITLLRKLPLIARRKLFTLIDKRVDKFTWACHSTRFMVVVNFLPVFLKFQRSSRYFSASERPAWCEVSSDTRSNTAKSLCRDYFDSEQRLHLSLSSSVLASTANGFLGGASSFKIAV